MIKKLLYEPDVEQERIDKYLRECLKISRERVKGFLKDGAILVNGRTVEPSYILQSNDEITIEENIPCLSSVALVKPEPGRIEIIYEDTDVVVVNKPPGVLTHPTDKVLTGTLVNLLLYRTTLSSIGQPYRPGVVHRLDKDTSGVIVFARTDYAHNFIVRQFQNRQVEKEYIALVQGRFKPLKTQVEFSITPGKENHTRMEVHYLRGKKAVTVLEVVKYIDNLTVVKAKPVTGRTHQIRITLAHLGYPVIGDPKYGIKSNLINRTALHSHSITLTLPSTGEKRSFMADIPDDIQKIIGH